MDVDRFKMGSTIDNAHSVSLNQGSHNTRSKVRPQCDHLHEGYVIEEF
jgi:hypothetical protein